MKVSPMPRSLGAPCLPLCAVVVAGVAVCHAQESSLDVMLERLGSYIQRYETAVSDLVAEERYEQWITRRPSYGGGRVGRRTLESLFFLIRLPTGQAWYGFRDVMNVDGNPVKRGDRSMEQVLRERAPDALNEALRMARESARYNIGDVYRTINVPLMAIELLDPQNRQHFDFTSAGGAREAGRRAWRIDYVERAAPAIIGDGFGGGVPAHGRVWVDPDAGTVLKTELKAGDGNPALRGDATITVEYRRDARFGVFLPFEMNETYPLAIETVHGRARYRNYRRFETSARVLTPSN